MCADVEKWCVCEGGVITSGMKSNKKEKTMRYKLLGKSGLRVSELSLGTMTFGEEWGWGSSKDESRRVFDHYVKAGGNFIDTANLYTLGTSEKFVGEFIGSEREKFVVATKYTLNTRRDDPNGGGNHRKNMVQAVEASLKRLNTDYIDLYWVHAWDYMTPVAEVMRALDDLVRAGKILYVGVSDTPAWVVSRANTMADLMGWSRFVGLQIRYSLIDRTVERELLPMAREMDIAVTPWSALGSGVLTGKFTRSDTTEQSLRHQDAENRTGALAEKNLIIAREVDKIADEIGKTSSQVALSWIRQQPGNIIPIIGARTESQLKDNLGCLEFELTQEHLDHLSEISKIEMGFPHDFLGEDFINDIIHGGTQDKIDNHRNR